MLSFVLAANLRKIVQFHLPFRAKSATFSSERKQFATGPFLVQGYPLVLDFAAAPCIYHKKAVFSSCLSVVACLHFNVSLHLLSRACRTYPATYTPKTPADTLEHSSETEVTLPMAKNICKTIFSAFILWYFIAGEMICVYLHARKEANIPVAITIVLSNVTATRTCILEFEQKDSTTTATPELPLSREINGGNLDGSGKKCDSQGRAIPQIFLNDDKHK